MKKKQNNGFTLVELLAVIVILAIILVIAVPKVMSVIEDAKKATLESTAKMIASQAEKAKVQNTVLGNDKEITCDSVAKINDTDYDKCIIEFDENNNALVTINGKGKFANLNVCRGDKSNATASNDVCTVSYGKASTYIEKLEAFTTNNGLIVDTTADKNIRYVGSNPNNYVYFNCKDEDSSDISYGSDNYDYANSCEVWRIIGVFEVDNGSGKIEKRVKLVRDAFPVSMSYDSSSSDINSGRGINQWGPSTYEDGIEYKGSDLMQMLNEYYIRKEGSTCTYCNGENQVTCENDCSSNVTPLSKTSLSMVEDVIWNIGGQVWLDTMPLLTMYVSERETQSGKICVASSICEGKQQCTDRVVRTTKWTGLVGLIYPSDYGFASIDVNCVSDIYHTNSPCANNNWLHPTKWYWTLSPVSISNRASLNYVVDNFSKVNTGHLSNDGGIRPTLYLSSNVEIIGGDGSSGNAYKLVLN